MSKREKEAFEVDTVVDGVGDADAAYVTDTTVLGASKSAKQNFSKGLKFVVIEQGGQDQGLIICFWRQNF